MLFSRLIWTSHRCELHSDESVLQVPEKHFSPCFKSKVQIHLFQTPTRSVIKAGFHYSHEDKETQWHKHSEWALRPNTCKQRPTTDQIRFDRHGSDGTIWVALRRYKKKNFQYCCLPRGSLQSSSCYSWQGFSTSVLCQYK